MADVNRPLVTYSDDYLKWLDQAARIEDTPAQPEKRPGWDEYFLGICRAVSARADCTRRKVGAVIVGTDHRIISTGYNGPPPGEPGCLSDGECPRGQKSIAELPSGGSYDSGPDTVCIAIHAEANAVIYAGREARGGTIYCTDKPCYGCYKLIRGAGIENIIVAS